MRFFIYFLVFNNVSTSFKITGKIKVNIKQEENVRLLCQGNEHSNIDRNVISLYLTKRTTNWS